MGDWIQNGRVREGSFKMKNGCRAFRAEGTAECSAWAAAGLGRSPSGKGRWGKLGSRRRRGRALEDMPMAARKDNC